MKKTMKTVIIHNPFNRLKIPLKQVDLKLYLQTRVKRSLCFDSLTASGVDWCGLDGIVDGAGWNRRVKLFDEPSCFEMTSEGKAKVHALSSAWK